MPLIRSYFLTLAKSACPNLKESAKVYGGTETKI